MIIQLFKHRQHLDLIRYISLHNQSAPPQRLDLPCHPFGGIAVAVVVDRYIPAGPGTVQADGGTYSAASTGHQHSS